MNYFFWLLRSSFIVKLITSFLQEKNFFIFENKNDYWKFLLNDFISSVLFCIFFTDYNLNFLNYILFLGLSICSLTDILERNVYLIIPLILFICNFFYKLYNKFFIELFFNLLFCLFIFLLLYAINYFFKKKYSMDGIGFGDIFLLSSISVYFNPLIFFIILFISSFTGSLFIILNNFFSKYYKIVTNELEIPFVPFIFIGSFTYLYFLKYIMLN